MTKTQALQEQATISDISKEAMEIIDILDRIDSLTANLRKKLISELKSQNKAIHLDLDNV